MGGQMQELALAGLGRGYVAAKVHGCHRDSSRRYVRSGIGRHMPPRWLRPMFRPEDRHPSQEGRGSVVGVLEAVDGCGAAGSSGEVDLAVCCGTSADETQSRHAGARARGLIRAGGRLAQSQSCRWDAEALPKRLACQPNQSGCKERLTWLQAFVCPGRSAWMACGHTQVDLCALKSSK